MAKSSGQSSSFLPYGSREIDQAKNDRSIDFLLGSVFQAIN
jgi:hypothetical protein